MSTEPLSKSLRKWAEVAQGCGNEERADLMRHFADRAFALEARLATLEAAELERDAAWAQHPRRTLRPRRQARPVAAGARRAGGGGRRVGRPVQDHARGPRRPAAPGNRGRHHGRPGRGRRVRGEDAPMHTPQRP